MKNQTSNGLFVPIKTYRRMVRSLLALYGRESFGKEAVKAIELADACGVNTHGILSVRRLATAVINAAGGIRGRKSPARIRRGPVSIWDARGVPGPTALSEIVTKTVEMAKMFGTGGAVIRNAGHIIFPEPLYAAVQNSRVIVNWSSTSPTTAVSYHGGRKAVLGSNVENWLFPVGGEWGIVWIDQALTEVSLGAVSLSKSSGDRLPKAAATDAKGRPTDEVSKIEALVPFGGVRGANLSLAKEILSAFAGGISHDGRFVTAFLTVIDPSSIGYGTTSEEQKRRVTDLLKKICQSGGSVRIPGKRRLSMLQLSKRLGGMIFPSSQQTALVETAKLLKIRLKLKSIDVLPALLR